jgi:hypothetical protein
VFVASLFEFTYAAKDCIANGSCADERAFAVSVGVISFIFCLFQLMFVRLGAPAGESHECCEVRHHVLLPRSALQWREIIPVCACVSWGGGWGVHVKMGATESFRCWFVSGFIDRQSRTQCRALNGIALTHTHFFRAFQESCAPSQWDCFLWCCGQRALAPTRAPTVRFKARATTLTDSSRRGSAGVLHSSTLLPTPLLDHMRVSFYTADHT